MEYCSSLKLIKEKEIERRKIERVTVHSWPFVAPKSQDLTEKHES